VRAQGQAGDPVALLDPADGVQLPAQLELGRRLFYSGITPTITTPLSGVSCATCHFESRNDGLSWMEIDGIFRQTLSLAGPMSETAPFTWNNDVATVADEVEITSQARLGGRGGTQELYDAVAAYIESTPEIDHARRGERSAAADRGAALFADPQVGCARCHSGPRFTDQQPHDLYGLEQVDTPSLIGVAATAPYLHDGSAPTLRAVLESATAAGMGDVSGLDDAALSDLEAYLRTL
jgi:cytochrome c peroxidase